MTLHNKCKIYTIVYIAQQITKNNKKDCKKHKEYFLKSIANRLQNCYNTNCRSVMRIFSSVTRQ